MNTKTETKHTPTPWSVQFFEETAGPDAGKSISEIHTDGVSICKVINTHTYDREWCQESDANMKFIVRAVNNHEALLDALKTWQKFWDTMPKGQMGKLSFDVGLFNDGFIKMGKAIARAEGR